MNNSNLSKIVVVLVIVTILLYLYVLPSQQDVVNNSKNEIKVKTTHLPVVQSTNLNHRLDENSLKIYIDADRSSARDSGLSIEKGVKTALSEVGNKIFGKKVEIVLCDHHGNSQRSKMHLEKYLKDDNALVVFSGLHSPPLLAHREFINKNGIVVLDPWAAAGPITRYPSKDNSIFRLSVDDWKAGPFIINHLVTNGFKKPFLVLEDTGWGKSNKKNMTKAIANKKIKLAGVRWFNWSLNQAKTIEIFDEIINSNADCVVLVSNAAEGSTIVKYMAKLEKKRKLPIFSHWGIVDSKFTKKISYELSSSLQLCFIQTTFSFFNKDISPSQKAVFKRLQSLYPKIKSAYDLPAPTGFVHAYDLTKILIAACEQTTRDKSINVTRRNIRLSLESVAKPVKGLIKTYHKPFNSFNQNDQDAHEALDSSDFSMASFGERGEVLLIEK